MLVNLYQQPHLIFNETDLSTFMNKFSIDNLDHE